MDNLITLENGESKLISESKIGDIVKSVDSNGQVVDSEIISIMHKNTNMTSNVFRMTDAYLRIKNLNRLFITNYL